MFFGSLLCSALSQNTIRALRFVGNSRHAAKQQGTSSLCYVFFNRLLARLITPGIHKQCQRIPTSLLYRIEIRLYAQKYQGAQYLALSTHYYCCSHSFLVNVRVTRCNDCVTPECNIRARCVSTCTVLSMH